MFNCRSFLWYAVPLDPRLEWGHGAVRQLEMVPMLGPSHPKSCSRASGKSNAWGSRIPWCCLYFASGFQVFDPFLLLMKYIRRYRGCNHPLADRPLLWENRGVPSRFQNCWYIVFACGHSYSPEGISTDWCRRESLAGWFITQWCICVGGIDRSLFASSGSSAMIFLGRCGPLIHDLYDIRISMHGYLRVKRAFRRMWDILDGLNNQNLPFFSAWMQECEEEETNRKKEWPEMVKTHWEMWMKSHFRNKATFWYTLA